MQGKTKSPQMKDEMKQAQRHAPSWPLSCTNQCPEWLPGICLVPSDIFIKVTENILYGVIVLCPVRQSDHTSMQCVWILLVYPHYFLLGSSPCHSNVAAGAWPLLPGFVYHSMSAVLDWGGIMELITQGLRTGEVPSMAIFSFSFISVLIFHK